jgi:hypothetical protein
MNETESGVVSRQGVLDLSQLTSADQLAGIRRIERVGTVIVPVSLAAAYATIPVTRVGNTIYVPDGARVRVHTGPLMVGGDGLGSAEDVLIVIGVLIVTSRSPVRYRARSVWSAWCSHRRAASRRSDRRSAAGWAA